MERTLAILLVLLICSACENKPPKHLIPEETLVPMLVDFQLANSTQQNLEFRKIAAEYDSIEPFSYIFEKHGYTKAEFDTTISWYMRNSEYFVDMYDEVIMRLTQINDSINPD
jgi:hypothetical protein